MSITAKLTSAFRGGVREAAENVIDSNSIRILGQEIHDFENDISDSKQKLALILTQAMQVERQISQIKNSVEEKEQAVISLIKADNEAAAIELAEEISELEAKEKQLSQHQTALRTHEQSLNASLKTMISHLDTYKSEYNMAKANENMQKAQNKLSQSKQGSKNHISNIQSSLERIQERQQNSADQFDAMSQVEANLDTQTKNTFKKPGPSASAILERLKEKSQ